MKKISKLVDLVYRISHRIYETVTGRSKRGYLVINQLEFPKGIEHNQKAAEFIQNIQVGSGGRISVQSGPFKGMRYDGIIAGGSSLYPKILGTYESELAFIFSSSEWPYSMFIDVGCGEGYYVVGVAMRHPLCDCIGYDINNKSISEATRLGAINGFSKNNMFLSCEFNPKVLLDFPDHKILLMVDIEGAEINLISDLLAVMKSNGGNLLKIDFLIEMHPMYSISNCDKMLRLIETELVSHSVQIIRSVSDYEKPIIGYDSSLENLDPETRFCLLRERGMSTPWCYVKSKERVPSLMPE